jgi:hypothetical protein
VVTPFEPIPTTVTKGVFVAWSCGCIGIDAADHTRDGRGKPDTGIVVIPCDDREGNTLTWSIRNMGGKAMTPLSADDEAALHRALAHRLAKADQFDQIRHALGLTEMEVGR